MSPLDERQPKEIQGLLSEREAQLQLARLRAMPTARLCLKHQAEWERSHPSAPPFTV